SPLLSEWRGRPKREGEQICSWQQMTLQPAIAGCYARIGPAPLASGWATSLLILGPIRRLRRHDPANAAPRIRGVTLPASNNVNMGVHDCLARRRAVVHADIEPIGLQFGP